MPERPRGRQPENWRAIEKRIGATPEAPLLTAKEVAGMLGIRRGKAFALLNSGELPAIRIGAALRVQAAELERWIDRERAHRVLRDRRRRPNRERED